MPTVTRQPAIARTGPWLPYPWELLVLLWLAFFLHQADRQIFNNLLPLIRSDLRLTDVQLGLVASVFTASYGVCVMLGGYAGDVLRRKWIVVVSLVVWSAATLLTGLSTGVLALIVFRGVATGGGEAFYFPSATSLISQFHSASRATALAVHQSALYFGIVASFVAGYVGERWGWRSAFFIFGGFGLLLGGVLWRRLQDTPHEVSGGNGVTEARPPLGEVVRAIGRKPTALLLCAALAGHVFVCIGYVTWMPTFLHERFGMTLTAAGFSSLAYHHAFAFVGVLLGGRLSDAWAPRRRTVRMEFECLGLLLGSPFVFWMGQAGSVTACCAALAFFGLFRGIYDSNLWAALFDVIEPRYRASATGLMLSCAFIVGALAPVLMAWTKGAFGLSLSISGLAAAYFGASMIVLVALRTTFKNDYCST